MLMTQLAMMDPGPAGSSVLSRCMRRIAIFFGFGAPRPEEPSTTYLRSLHPAPSPASSPVAGPSLRIVRTHEDTGSESIATFRWRRHTQLLDRPMSTLADEERGARQHAVRGLYAARNGALDVAEHHFSLAAACPDIDLCEIPGFWQLDRSAMLVAVRAYERADRLRDASALNAQIRTLYRPHALSPVPGNVRELTARRLSLSSNS